MIKHTPAWLGPCPFCGEMHAVRLLEREGLFFVWCEHCGASGPLMETGATASAWWKMTTADRFKGAGVDLADISGTKVFCAQLNGMHKDIFSKSPTDALPAERYGLPPEVDAYLAEFKD